jgi:hypothetical protein
MDKKVESYRGNKQKSSAWRQKMHAQKNRDPCAAVSQ